MDQGVDTWRTSWSKAFQRLSTATGSIWLFTCDPFTARTFDGAGRDTWMTSWRVRSPVSDGDVRPGDRAALWVSGRAAGVYALGQIEGTSMPGPISRSSLRRSAGADTYNRAGSQPSPAPPVTYFHLDLYLDLFDHFIERADLLRDERCAASTGTFRMSQSGEELRTHGNPDSLSEDEWQAILELADLPWMARPGTWKTRRLAMWIESKVVESLRAGLPAPLIDFGGEDQAAYIGVGLDESRDVAFELYRITQERWDTDHPVPFIWNT